MQQKEKKVITPRNNILKILNNVGTIFTGTYLHHKDVPKKNNVRKKYRSENKIKKRKG